MSMDSGRSALLSGAKSSRRPRARELVKKRSRPSSGMPSSRRSGDRQAETEVLIGIALYRNPDQLRLLKSDPSLITDAIEELLRYDSSVQGTGRTTQENVDEISASRSKRGSLRCVCTARPSKKEIARRLWISFTQGSFTLPPSWDKLEANARTEAKAAQPGIVTLRSSEKAGRIEPPLRR
jgi:hypothetical protein